MRQLQKFIRYSSVLKSCGRRKLSIVLTAALMLVAQSEAFANASKGITELTIDDASSYLLIENPQARLPLQNFFSELRRLGVARNLMLVPELGHMMLLTEFQAAPVRPSCDSIFCHDEEMWTLLVNEIEAGRPIILTHSFNGLFAFAMDPFSNDATLVSLIARLNVKGRGVLGITPLSEISSVVHELAHTEDYETGALRELDDLIANLVAIKALPDGHYIRHLASEVRAYERQRLFLESQTREMEFSKELPGYVTMLTPVIRVNGHQYRQAKLKQIKKNVMSMYVVPAREILFAKGLDANSRERLLEALKKLLPADGPFSFDALLTANVPG